MIPIFQNKKAEFILWAAFLLGTLLRFIPGFLAGFPLNDGGMFLSMIRDLHSNQFFLPPLTSYNFSDIPFAYPPFGLYIAAFLSSILPISEIEILIWLPALVSAAIIPVFYWLSLEISLSKSKAVIATALYALMPGSADWLVMGGGLTRAFGIFFYLLAFGSVYRLFHEGGRRTIWLSILFCSLAVLSHPEVGLQTAGLCFVLWLLYGRNLAGFTNAALVAFGTALLTAPWWLTVLLQHGFAPFWSAIHTGIRETLLASLFHSFFSTQGGLPILPIFSLIGMISVIRKREVLLIASTLLPFFIDPRNAPAVAIFPIIMLASEGFYFLSTELNRAYSEAMQKRNKTTANFSWLTDGIFGVLLLYLIVVSFASVRNLVRASLTTADRETMQWVKTNTPAGSRFLLITNVGQISPMTDSFQEWFPVLAERRSQNTLQGTEWALGQRFFPYSLELISLQACRSADCLQDWITSNKVQFDFLLLRKKDISPELLISLRKDGDYLLYYESADAVIFSVNSRFGKTLAFILPQTKDLLE